jgi:acyl-[acyl-carrier-protein]-phospholipid O-acyltransferase/long-chain-fatty-acid--[acyl-carrier-protein] ligase
MFRALMTSRRSGESPSILVFSLRALWRVLFRLEVAGWENLASAGAPNIVMVDHVSWLDAPILFSLPETPATFVIEPAAAKNWPQRLFLRFADARVLDHDKPLDLRALVREARQDQLCGAGQGAQRSGA